MSRTQGVAHDFERVYAEAAGDRSRIRWDDGRPNPLLVDWLNLRAQDVVRPGARIVVIGCGLGHDARELVRRGYDVAAFDISPTAIEWARSLDADAAEVFQVADLFELPSRWRRRFDLAVEINTVQSLPPEFRPRSLGAIESLIHAHGAVLLICRGADRPQGMADGPPWALTVAELAELAAGCGLSAEEGYELLVDGETPPQRRIRALLRRVARA